MKRAFRLFSLLIVAVIVSFFSVSAVSAEGGIDWEKNTITVIGTGFPPQKAVNPAQSRLLARRAALVDAYRMLAESVNGVNVDAETIVENLVVKNDLVKTKVSACIKGATIIAEREIPGGYEVTMQLQMFGGNNPLAAAVLERPTYQEPFPEPDESVASYENTAIATVNVDVNIGGQTSGRQSTASMLLMAPNKSTAFTYDNLSRQPNLQSLAADSTDTSNDSFGNVEHLRIDTASVAENPQSVSGNTYTGLIVDCRGLGLNAAMSPVVKNEKGVPVYGHKNLDYDLVISKGMVSYTTDIDNHDRAGSRPLVVKAKSLQNFNGNPVISVKDANRVLIENKKSGFLDNMNVVFVK